MSSTEPTKPRKRKSSPRRKVSPQERMTIIQLWTSGQGKVQEIADAMRRPTSTIYNVLMSAGLWPGYDDYAKAGTTPDRNKDTPGLARKQPKPVIKIVKDKPPKIVMPEPTPVEAGTITMIRGPKRSLWQRIKDFFQ